MQLLDHENVLKVFEIGTIYEEGGGGPDSDDSDEEDDVEESYPDEKDKEININEEVKESIAAEEDADYFIIMEKAEKSLHDEIYRRKYKK